QAEDGIRDGHVTGVQTCALPIWIQQPLSEWLGIGRTSGSQHIGLDVLVGQSAELARWLSRKLAAAVGWSVVFRRTRIEPGMVWRSEERRVGKEGRCGCVWCRER